MHSIAMLGWALPSLGAREGSGYNLNAGELAAGLAARGHKVSFLRSGVAFSFKGPVRICHECVWRGVVCDDVVNSPVAAPAYFSFAHPETEMRSEELVRVVMSWLDKVQADVVHVHSLEGFTHDVMGAIARSGRRLVTTLHNHWFVCPQVDLFYRHAEPCSDYEGGRKCEKCTRPPSLVHTRTAASGRRVGERWTRAWTQPQPDPWKIKQFLRWSLRTPTAPPPYELATPSVIAGADRRLLAANDKLVVLNRYGERRTSALAAINAAHRILVPSGWMRDVALSFGLSPSKVVRVPLGQPHFDAIAAHPRARPIWRPGDQRPLRVAFLGSGDRHKGLQVLVEALEANSPLPQFEACIRAAWIPDSLASRLQRLPGVMLGGGYSVDELPNLLAETDLVVYPQVCFDNSPLVVMEAFHAGVPVVASDLGGPRSLVSHQVNGLLFRAGDPAALRNSLTSILDGSWCLPTASEVRTSAALPKFQDYVSAVEREYEHNPVG